MSDNSLETLIREALKEFRRQRRNRWWMRGFLLLAILILVSVPMFEDLLVEETKSHVALVDLEGVIGIGADASADRINDGLRDAFKADQVTGLILRVNSPGGSPVQSRQINAEIDRLQALHPDLPVYAVIEDIGASGGYYAAVAADRIYADPASIVGSIGVRMDSFGFVEALKNLGVERRLLTAGENKGVLDPFLPLENDEVEFVESLLETVHQQFINAVRQGRGDRLVANDPSVFSGLFWSGEQALPLGLIDDFGSVDSVARDVLGEARVVNYTPGFDILDSLARDFGVLVENLINRINASGYPRLQ